MEEKITLICTSLNPDLELLDKMIDSAKGFDAVVLNIDRASKVFYGRNGYKEPKVHHVGTFESLSIPNAYNWMIQEYVKTEWICCMCDDDYFYPEGLSKMIAEVHKGIDADVAHFKFRISGYMPPQDKRGRILQLLTGKSEYILCERGNVADQLAKGHNRLPAGSFFRKSAWGKVNGYQGDKCHDHDLWHRMSKAGCRFKYFDHLTYNYVRRDKSAWVKQNGH